MITKPGHGALPGSAGLRAEQPVAGTCCGGFSLQTVDIWMIRGWRRAAGAEISSQFQGAEAFQTWLRMGLAWTAPGSGQQASAPGL